MGLNQISRNMCQFLIDGNSQYFFNFATVWTTKIEQSILKLKNREFAIDGRTWIASLFHPVLFSEGVQQHLTVNKDNLQEEPLRAMKARVYARFEKQNQQTVS